jgi:hypothetical protein
LQEKPVTSEIRVVYEPLCQGRGFAELALPEDTFAKPAPAGPVVGHFIQDQPPLLLGRTMVPDVRVNGGQVLPRLEAANPPVHAVEVPLPLVIENRLVNGYRFFQPAKFMEQERLAKSNLQVLGKELHAALARLPGRLPVAGPAIGVNQKGVCLVEVRFLRAGVLDRARRLEDGIVIYTLGPDGQDNGGALSREYKPAPGTDIGFRLWDPEQRLGQKRPDDGKH